MNVSDIMTEKPVTVHQNSTLYDALEKMEQAGCHHLPVIDSEGHLVGIISDRDCGKALDSLCLLDKDRQEKEVARHVIVRSLMTPAPIVTETDASAEEAARLMLCNRISCLPVMRSETLIGIVTKSDILMAFMKMQRRYRQHLNEEEKK